MSKATISAAERSVDAPPNRVRKFLVSDLVAFCQIFGVTIEWFLNPPPVACAPDRRTETLELLRAIEGPWGSSPLNAVRWFELEQLEPAFMAEYEKTQKSATPEDRRRYHELQDPNVLPPPETMGES